MPLSTKAASPILLLAVALAGCAADERRLSVVAVEADGIDGPELQLRLSLPASLRQALERGVPLSFRLDVERDGASIRRWRELRYLPLSRQYQVREPASGYSRGYDSRAGALAALERWPLPGLVAGDRNRPVIVRVRLDNTRLPAPLVLPALFDRDWRLDSGRVRWPD